MLAHKLQEVGDPLCGGCGRASHEQAAIYCFDSARSNIIESKVILLCACPEHFEIRLVPDFKAPLAYLVYAVTLHQVCDKSGIQFPPAPPVARRGDNTAVGEDSRVRIRGQVARHERHLYNWAQVQTKQAVENTVYGGEIVMCLPV